MKVVMINGSRREKGCTYTALNEVAAVLNAEGIQILRTLGTNMAWILKSIEAGIKAGVRQPESEDKVFTNYIR